VARTLGVEEEYQLIDAETGQLRQANQEVLRAAGAAMGETVHPELLRSQIEVATPVCDSLDDLDRKLRSLRSRLEAAAARYGCLLGAAGTHPTARWEAQEVTPKQRYLDLAEDFQQLARSTLIFGCHVHVGIPEQDLRIEVMNRVRPWLPVVLALSANSPFWAGADTGYASYRTVVFRRWPLTGLPLRFADYREYSDLIDTLVRSGAIEDATKVYWDVRPSVLFPTLEFRIADVCSTVDDAVTLAGVFSGLVGGAERDARAGLPSPDPRPELLDAAVWRAARHGVETDLIDVMAGRPRPAADVVDDLLLAVRPALEETGEADRVEAGVRQILREGTGARRQRLAYQRAQRFDDVIGLITGETATSVKSPLPMNQVPEGA
jgi:carboxylate-amine ligase